MGNKSKILSGADIRTKKRAARDTLTVLKAQKKEQRTALKNFRTQLKTASTSFGKAEREFAKIARAVTKQEEKIASF